MPHRFELDADRLIVRDEAGHVVLNDSMSNALTLLVSLALDGKPRQARAIVAGRTRFGDAPAPAPSELTRRERMRARVRRKGASNERHNEPKG